MLIRQSPIFKILVAGSRAFARRFRQVESPANARIVARSRSNTHPVRFLRALRDMPGRSASWHNGATPRATGPPSSRRSPPLDLSYFVALCCNEIKEHLPHMARAGRPPIGERAMTSTERSRLRRARLRAAGKPARVIEHERELAKARPVTKLARTTRSASDRRSAAEIVKLKSDIFKLKAMLQEEPDAAKLRKQVVDQKVEMAAMRKAMKEIAKQRDKWRSYGLVIGKIGEEGTRLLSRDTFATIAKGLHPDRLQTCSKVELDRAARLFLRLRPLFVEERK
jgi:hypothetical protein